jgi:hypothetical protein
MMKKTVFLLALISILLLASTALALAPPPGLQLSWWVMGGGGSPHSSGPLQMNGTIGQAAIGHTDAGPLSLDWGYWPQQMPKLYQPVILK